MKLPYFVIIVTIISAIFQLPDAQLLVMWNINLIHHGQWWRILSGNLTHTNIPHLVMNIAALWILCYLFKPSSSRLCVLLISLSLFVGLGLLMTSLHSYAGLSGVLHGLFAYYAICEVTQGRKSSWLLVIGVICKIGYEQLYGASSSTAALINAQVATEAHLIGGIAGAILAIIVFLTKLRRDKTTHSNRLV